MNPEPQTATSPAGLVDLLDASARGGTSIGFIESAERVDLAELWSDAHRCAGWIQRNLADEGTIAGVLEPSRRSLVTLLGTWLSSRRFASLPRAARGMAPAAYVRQLQQLVELVGAGVIVMPDDLAVDVPGYRRLPLGDVGRSAATAGSDTGSLVQFTSGSTGSPTGVVLGMREIGANAIAMAQTMDYGPADVFISWLPLSHDMGLIGMCLAPLAAGALTTGDGPTTWIAEPARFARDPGSWLRMASDLGGTITMVPNAALELAARALERRPDVLDLRSLRGVVVGSETVSASSVRRFLAATGSHGLDPDSICPSYGLAEATLAVTATRPAERWTARPSGEHPLGDLPREVVGLGTPLPGVEVRIGPGSEIQVRGPSVASGFLGRPDPRQTDGWLHTADLGEIVDGVLHFHARRSEVLVVAGRNIDGGMLQREVGGCPAVRTGCCVVVDDRAGGYLVAFEPATTEAASIRSLCGEVADAALALAGSSPSRVVALARGTLPKTPSGKAQPTQLRAGLESGDIVPLADVRRRRRAAGFIDAVAR